MMMSELQGWVQSRLSVHSLIPPFEKGGGRPIFQSVLKGGTNFFCLKRRGKPKGGDKPKKGGLAIFQHISAI